MTAIEREEMELDLANQDMLDALDWFYSRELEAEQEDQCYGVILNGVFRS